MAEAWSPSAHDLRPSAAALGRFVAAKFLVLDFHLGVFLAWSLLPRTELLSARTLVLVVISFAVMVLSLSAGMALDDVQGGRDGSDRVNYLASDGTGLRALHRKPLLTGAVTETDANRVALLAAGAALVIGIVTILIVHAPWWTLAGAVITMAVVLQYSMGLKLSYRYLWGGPSVLAIAAAANVVLPHGVMAGATSSVALVEAAVFAAWFPLIAAFSCLYDTAGDRAAGRRTIAVVLSWRANRVYVVALLASTWALLVGAAVAGWSSWWHVVALLPVLVLEVHMVRLGFGGGDVLAARRLGFRLVGLGVALLCIVNVALS